MILILLRSLALGLAFVIFLPLLGWLIPILIFANPNRLLEAHLGEDGEDE